MKEIKKHYFIKIVISVLAIFFPLAISLNKVLMGNINFWYDPARDFLLGIDNLTKITLIGQTSGIPGIFYGPYWIWMISTGLIFSKDPRFVTFLILTVPYFTIFPFILFQFRKLFGFVTCIILWMLFMFSSGIYYATNPWNPYPAPLLFLALIYLLTFTDFSEKGKIKFLKLLGIGIISGLTLNFHISFGLCVSSGIILFFITDLTRSILKSRKKWKELLTATALRILIFGFGIFITFIPFLIFELRHGFNQIQAAINVFTTKGSVVTVKGLSKWMVLQSFFNKSAEVLKVPLVYAGLFFASGIGYFIYIFRKKKFILAENEIKLMIFLFCVSVTTLALYLTSKNPVWGYHFIGVELIFIFAIGIIINKIKFFKIILGVWLICSSIFNAKSIIDEFYADPLTVSSLASKENIVKSISADSDKKQYTVFAYSPSIYVYEYEYLFKWLSDKKVPYDPGRNPTDSNTVYLIIPPVAQAAEENFINYRTPENNYKTTKKWDTQDGSMIIKREKK